MVSRALAARRGVRAGGDLEEAGARHRERVSWSTVASKLPKHIGHTEKGIAYHMEWGFRKDAIRYFGGRPVGPNLEPVAGDVRRWLLREGMFKIFAVQDKAHPVAYTNPYTYHSTSLASILAASVNDSHAFAIGTEVIDALDAEIARVRLFNEHVLYAARFCEALIKQLLFCTQFPIDYYERASLGQLMSIPCRGCQASNAQRHNISLLGSLAHRYGLCLEVEKCLLDHMKIVARRRNLEAAHAESTILDVRSASASREKLGVDALELGNDLVHILGHIAKIESHVIQELDSIARRNSTIILKPSDV